MRYNSRGDAGLLRLLPPGVPVDFYAILIGMAHKTGVRVMLDSSGEPQVEYTLSEADKADNSWQNPSLFGRGIFFKIGSTDIPQPSVVEAAAVVPAGPAINKSGLAVNQIGYFLNAAKTAALAKPGVEALKWSLIDAATKAEVTNGTTTPGIDDPVSGDTVHTADFSSFNKEGTYIITIDGIQSSPFRIGKNVVTSLAKDSLAYFYRTRSGIELKPEYAGAVWARPAGHLSDAEITAYEGPDAQGKEWKTYDYIINGLGGWYDAGDFGKYVVNGGISVWTLQNEYERKPSVFKDGDLAIPENKNGAPDILDEARWEMEFMLHMQIPQGKELSGMSFHKLHDRNWTGVPTALPTEFNNNNSHNGSSTGRFVYEPTTAATLNLAATAAQASRLWQKQDAAFADRCLASAKTAWKAALANPALIAGNVPGSGGGNYDDNNVSDDFFWAAAELFATTGDQEYLDFLKKSKYFTDFPGLDTNSSSAMYWGDTAALGTITLAAVPNKLLKTDVDALRSQIIATADRYLKTIAGEGYRMPIDQSGYVWGSSSGVLNNAIILALAYDFTGKPEYRDGVVHSMDYILGFNGLLKSFVTGYGSNPVAHPHHRVWGNNPDAGYPPPPPGVLSGGPNANIQDPEMQSANLKALPISKRYLDIIGSYASNEVAINWNAPLAWICAWLDQQYNQ